MANGIDLILRLVGRDDGASAALKKTGDEASELNRKLKDVGGNDGLSQAEAKAENLTRSLEGVRNAGLALTAIGGVGIALSEHFADAYVEADRLGGRMNSLMTGAGLATGIEAVRALGNEIAGLTGNDDDQVSASISKAIVSGRVMGLREYGISIDGAGQAAIKAADKISLAAKQQETLNQVLRAGKNAANDLRAGMSEATATIGEFGVRYGNLEEEIGEGSAKIKASIIDGVLNPLLDVIDKDPELKATAGSVLSIGSMAATGVGGIVALGSQLGIAALGFKSLGITGVESLMAIQVAGAPLVATIGTIGLAVVAAGATFLVLYKIAESVGAKLKEVLGGEWAEKLINAAGIIYGGPGGLGIQMAARQINAPATPATAASGSDPAAMLETARKGISDATSGATRTTTTPPSIPTIGVDESDGESESEPASTRGGSKEAKKAEAAQAKAQKTAERLMTKAQREAEKDKKEDARDNLELARARIEAASENQVFDLEQQLHAATEAKNEGMMQNLTLQIVQTKAQADYNEAMTAASQETGSRRGTMEEIARLKYGSATRNVDLPTLPVVSGKSKGLSAASALSLLSSGGNVFGLGKIDSSGSGASGGGSQTVTAQVQSMKTQPDGAVIVQFAPLVIRRGGFDSMLGAM